MININFIKGDNLNILDYGCGSGINTILLLNLGHNVTGVDLNPKCGRDIISKIGNKASKRFNFKLAHEVDFLSIGSMKYDLIICTETLEHIISYENTIKYFGKIIKKGGILIVSVPTHFSEKLFSFIDNNWLDDSKHINIFKEKDLIKHFLINDFKLFAKERKGSEWFVTWCILKLFLIRHNMGIPIVKNDFQRYITKITCRFVNIIRLIKPINKLMDFLIPKSIVFYFKK